MQPHMIHESPNRQIVIGNTLQLKLPEDLSLLTQICCGRPSVKVVETYRNFKIPKENNDLFSILQKYRNVKCDYDVIAHIPNGKILEDNLVSFLVEMRNEFLKKKDVVEASKIDNKLRAMGIVLTDRKEAFLFWNEAGEIPKE